MKSLCVSVFLVVYTLSFNARADIITTAVNPANGHTYHLLSQTTWTQGEAEATSLGGHLVTINDAAENSWLVSVFSNFGGTPRAFFIGLNDVASEGTYVWSSGETSAFINFADGEPNNFVGGNEDYIMMWQSGIGLDGKWNDFVNENSLSNPTFGTIPLYAVAEITAVPEPSSVILVLAAGALLACRTRRNQKRRTKNCIEVLGRPVSTCVESPARTR